MAFPGGEDADSRVWLFEVFVKHKIPFPKKAITLAPPHTTGWEVAEESDAGSPKLRWGGPDYLGHSVNAKDLNQPS